MVVMAGIGKSSRGHGRWFAVREGGRTVGSGILKGIIHQKQIYKGRKNNEMSIL